MFTTSSDCELPSFSVEEELLDGVMLGSIEFGGIGIEILEFALDFCKAVLCFPVAKYLKTVLIKKKKLIYKSIIIFTFLYSTIRFAKFTTKERFHGTKTQSYKELD